jgi:hypothetical protein
MLSASDLTTDSQGKEGLDILIVVAPSLPDNFIGDDVLDTLVQISDRLQRAGTNAFQSSHTQLKKSWRTLTLLNAQRAPYTICRGHKGL